jgi:ribosomal protein L6P/L9E
MTIWKKDQIRFNIGYNHLIYYNIPKGILIRSKSRRNLFLFSYSFFFLKRIGTEIKNFRKLSVYKLKGIKEKNELYSKKNWKKGLY